jgi:hypothetical protein
MRDTGFIYVWHYARLAESAFFRHSSDNSRLGGTKFKLQSLTQHSIFAGIIEHIESIYTHTGQAFIVLHQDVSPRCHVQKGPTPP